MKKEIGLQLLLGEDIKIEEFTLKNHSIKEIVEMGYSNYLSYVAIMAIDRLNIADILWVERKIFYKDVSNWELFIDILTKQKETQVVLEFFLNETFDIYRNDETKEYILKTKDGKILNETKFNTIHDILALNCNLEKEYYFTKARGDKSAQLMLKMLYKKRGNSSESSHDLESIISSVLWASSIGKEIWNCSLFALYDGYGRIVKKINYELTMAAYYNGNINKKDFKIKQIDWTKK